MTKQQKDEALRSIYSSVSEIFGEFPEFRPGKKEFRANNERLLLELEQKQRNAFPGVHTAAITIIQGRYSYIYRVDLNSNTETAAYGTMAALQDGRMYRGLISLSTESDDIHFLRCYLAEFAQHLRGKA